MFTNDSTTRRPASNLVSSWARGRREITPWAYRHLRGLAAIRFAVGVYLTGLGAVMLSYGHDRLAVIPFAGAAVLFAIAWLDFSAARTASPLP